MFSSRRIQTVVFVVALASAGFAAPLLAQSEGWQVRLAGQWLTTSGDDLFVKDGLDEGVGAYLGLERRINDRWGVELGVGWNEIEGSDQDQIDILGVTGMIHVDAETDWLPVSLAANFHLSPRSDFDVYVAGKIGYAFFDDVEVTTRLEVDFSGLPFPPEIVPDSSFTVSFAADDAFFYGLRVGGDWPIGNGGWHLGGYLDASFLELELSGPSIEGDVIPFDVSADLDPFTVGFGVSKRW